MKVEMAVVKKQYRQTRALEPEMMDSRTILVAENWVDRIERGSRGAIRRVPKVAQPKPRGRPRKTEQAAEG